MLKDVAARLDAIGFDADTTVLTERQAQILALRERGETQSAIAEELGTSRANISSIEASARENVERARETIAVVEALYAPATVSVTKGTDLYDVPDMVYDAADGASVKVDHDAPALMRFVTETAPEAVDGRQVTRDLIIGITSEGAVRVRLGASGV